MYFYYYDLIFILPALIISLWAQLSVKSAYSKYSKVRCRSGITGAEVARRILAQNGITNVRVEQTSGKLSDHYDPRGGVIRLSGEVYSGSSVAALGVSAHEAGHAVQHAEQYSPMKLRSTIIPITNICSYISYPLVLIGIAFSLSSIAHIGTILFGMVVVLQLVTLPVEFNASARALRVLPEMGLDEGELGGAKKVLRAAAMTYVAALFTALMNFLRLLSYVRRRD